MNTIYPKSLLLLCGLLSLFSEPLRAHSRDSLLLEVARAKDTTLAQLQLQIGVSYYQEGKLDSAIFWLEPSASLSKKLQLPEVLIRAQTNIGNCYADKGENPKALQFYQEALKDAEANGNKKYIANIQKNIGALHLSWKNLQEALNYYNKAEKTAILLKDSSLLADIYNNKGTVYEQWEKFPDALIYYGKALSFYESNGKDDGIAMSSSNMAIVYKLMGDFDKAILYNEKALFISKKIGDDWMCAAILNNIGNLYGQQGKLLQALLKLEDALFLARKIDAKEIVVMALESKADAASKAQLYEMAFQYMKAYTQAKDSFISEQQTAQFKELEVKYDTEKKEAQLSLQQAEIDKQESIIAFTILSTLLLGLFGYSAYKRYQNKKERQFMETLHAQEIKATQAIFHSEQNERFRIARDIHDSIGQLLSVIKMKINTAAQIENQNLTPLVDQAIKELRDISHNLIPEELGLGLYNGIESMVEKINEAGKLKIEAQIEDALIKKPLNKTFELSVYRIVQEILNNMLKHAQASHISIQIKESGEGITLNLIDNGIGFDSSKIEQSQGLGWKNIRARVNLLAGNMQIRSEPNKGTQITIQLPSVWKKI
jgi:signal transduction histidine kinase